MSVPIEDVWGVTGACIPLATWFLAAVIPSLLPSLSTVDHVSPQDLLRSSRAAPSRRLGSFPGGLATSCVFLLLFMWFALAPRRLFRVSAEVLPVFGPRTTISSPGSRLAQALPSARGHNLEDRARRRFPTFYCPGRGLCTMSQQDHRHGLSSFALSLLLPSHLRFAALLPLLSWSLLALAAFRLSWVSLALWCWPPRAGGGLLVP